jgi:hypothetical protein
MVDSIPTKNDGSKHIFLLPNPFASPFSSLCSDARLEDDISGTTFYQGMTLGVLHDHFRPVDLTVIGF